MSLTVTAKSAPSIAPLEAGTYPAVCYGLVDIGVQYNETYKNASPKVIIVWEIVGETVTIDGEEKPRVISSTYTASLSERAALRRDLERWRGQAFTEEELAGFDLKSIVGAPCLLTIVHRENNGRTYTNVDGVAKLTKGMERPVGTIEPMVFNLDSDPLEKMETLPEWMQERIKKSETYKDRVAGIGHGDTGSYEEPELVELDESDLPF